MCEILSIFGIYLDKHRSCVDGSGCQFYHSHCSWSAPTVVAWPQIFLKCSAIITQFSINGDIPSAFLAFRGFPLRNTIRTPMWCNIVQSKFCCSAFVVHWLCSWWDRHYSYHGSDQNASGTLVTNFIFCNSVFIGTSSSGFIHFYYMVHWFTFKQEVMYV